MICLVIAKIYLAPSIIRFKWVGTMTTFATASPFLFFIFIFHKIKIKKLNPYIFLLLLLSLNPYLKTDYKFQKEKEKREEDYREALTWPNGPVLLTFYEKRRKKSLFLWLCTSTLLCTCSASHNVTHHPKHVTP